ncbi:MAG: radical SAM protein [Fibrobacter sp.]|nr:radical SAM protein [Fibrobacter sp.]
MAPLLLHYYITNRCNSRCSFCDIWNESPKVDAKSDEVVQNLRHARKAGCKFVDFTGGEPLLHEDLPFFLSEARKLKFITSVTTNCILFPRVAPKISGLVDLLHFSIDADTPYLHNKIRGVSSFAAVMQSIEIAHQFNLTPDLLFTYTDENIDAFEGVYDLARRKRLMLILDPVFELSGKDNVSPETHKKALHYASKTGVYLNRAHQNLRSMGGNNIAHPQCKAVSSTIVILPDNKLAFPCYHHRKEQICLNNDLNFMVKSSVRKDFIKKQGTFNFCQGCHINCYFDPSYTFLRNKLFFNSLFSKLEYAWTKYILYGHVKTLIKSRYKKNLNQIC